MQRYNPNWTQMYADDGIEASRMSVELFYCRTCNKTCRLNNRDKDIKQHIRSKKHQDNNVGTIPWVEKYKDEVSRFSCFTN